MNDVETIAAARHHEELIGEAKELDRVLLIRIDERLKSLIHAFDKLSEIYVTKEQLESMKLDLARFLSENPVRREEFLPVQRIVYGGVGLILIGVFSALIALVIKR